MKTVYLVNRYVSSIKKEFEKKGYHVLQGNGNNRVEKADFVFSINFEPEIAEQCSKNNMKYVSWIVDCPHTVLFSKKLSNDKNYVFLFDYRLYCRMMELETEAHLFYLPLASAYEEFEQVLSASIADTKRFEADVSFLGRLYIDREHALFDQIDAFPKYVQGYLESLLRIQHMMWGVNIFREAISESVWKQINQVVKWDVGEDYYGHEKETMINILNQKLAQRERLELCNRLSEKYNFILYSQDDTSFNPAIVNRGYVDYMKEMPLVFAHSKINLNVTLRSIETGIPLRVLDVLGCGGFLLTNYQEEIAEYFQDGIDLVVYSDFEDMEQKIQYYLSHEAKRKAIAENGNKRVKELFGYGTQLEKIISILEEE